MSQTLTEPVKLAKMNLATKRACYFEEWVAPFKIDLDTTIF